MSAPEQGRQSPDPENLRPDQQTAHPGQPGSGKYVFPYLPIILTSIALLGLRLLQKPDQADANTG